MKSKKIRIVNPLRYSFFAICVLLFFGVFVYKMVDWQILNSSYYKMRANSSNVYFIKTDAVRGEILDSSGTPLAVNDTGYKAVIDRLLIESGKENELILKSVKLLESLGDSWIDILPVKIVGGKLSFESGKESQIESLRSELNLGGDASADDFMAAIMAKYKVSDTGSKEDNRIICSVKYGMDKNGVYYSKSTPYVLSNDVSKNTAIIISEKSEYLRGLRVQPCLTRKYVNSDIAPHIVGYTGFISGQEYEKLKDSYPMDAKIGKMGAESVFEEYLRGHGGTRLIQMSNGEITDVSEKEPSSAGNTVFLTISADLQRVANESLKKNIEQVRGSGVSDCNSGAAVVLDVSDFSVLAAASYPSFDLTEFTGDSSYYSKLAEDKAVPLLNKAFLGAYAPGSIYKPLVALATLQEGKVTPDEKIFCGGSFNFYKGYKLRCMGVHGGLNLTNALAKSCNVYFAELGRRLGADLLANWAKKFGIGVKTGVELAESEGVLAGEEHSKKVGAVWYESGSSQAAIGQSDNMFTPLQLATYVATIANGGKRYKTHILSKITDYSRRNVIKSFEPELLQETGISEENLNAVKNGMRQVALSGTARDFANYPIPIAAKTGTAQNSGTDHTTFICFAPYDAPKIAIAVVIEHGKTGMASKNVARDIMDAYFELKK